MPFNSSRFTASDPHVSGDVLSGRRLFDNPAPGTARSAAANPAAVHGDFPSGRFLRFTGTSGRPPLRQPAPELPEDVPVDRPKTARLVVEVHRSHFRGGGWGERYHVSTNVARTRWILWRAETDDDDYLPSEAAAWRDRRACGAPEAAVDMLTTLWAAELEERWDEPVITEVGEQLKGLELAEVLRGLRRG